MTFFRHLEDILKMSVTTGSVLYFLISNLLNFQKICTLYVKKFYFLSFTDHGDIMLTTSNNSQISIVRSMPQQAGGFIIKHLFGISNIVTCRQKMFSIGSLANNP